MSTRIDVIKAAVELAKRERLLDKCNSNPVPIESSRYALLTRTLPSVSDCKAYNRRKQLLFYRQRILAEYLYKEERSLYWVTLTFNNKYINKNPSQCFARFVEKLRRRGLGVEFVKIVEKGKKTDRLHYHCLLSIDNELACKELKSLWAYGRADIKYMNDLNIVEYMMKAFTVDRRSGNPKEKNISFSDGFGLIDIRAEERTDEELLDLSRLHKDSMDLSLVISVLAAKEYERRTGTAPRRVFNPGGYSMREVWRGEVPFERICGPRYWVHDYADPIRRWLEFINTKTRIAMEI